MTRSRLILVVLIIVAIAVAMPIVLNRYYLTPISQETVIENVQTQATTP